MAAGVPGDGIQNVRSARDFILQWYGTLATTMPRETDYTVGTTAALLGTQISQRLGLIISNTGTVNVALAFNQGVTITTGILLQPGAAFVSNWYVDLELVMRPIWAIGAAAGATLHMVENLTAGA